MELKMGMGRRGVRFPEEQGYWRLPVIFDVDDMVLCGESEGNGGKFYRGV